MMKLFYTFVAFVVAAYAFMHAATVCFAVEEDVYDYDMDGSETDFEENLEDFIPEFPDQLDDDVIFLPSESFDSDFFFDPDFDGSLSGNDIDYTMPDYDSQFDEIINILSDIQEYQSYGSYDGVIPEPYLTYMKDILSWATLSDNYVAFVSSYYYSNRTYNYYVLALGDISFNGSSFTGTAIDVYEFYPTVTGYSGTNYKHSLQSSFSYAPSGYLCFTDLSSSYPDLRGQTNRYLLVLLVVLALFVSFYTFTKFGFGNVSFRRRPRMPL